MTFRKTIIAAAIATACVGASAAAPPAPDRITAEEAIPRPVRKKRQNYSGGNLVRRFRSKWPADRPKRKTNREHISRRVRRKHRRAA